MLVKERETQALWHCDWSMSPMSLNSMSPKCYSRCSPRPNTSRNLTFI